MRHYSVEKLVDFARNVIHEDEKTEMQSHLDTGCSKCSKELNLWRRLHQVAQRESAYEPSGGAVRTVNAAFANQRIARTRNAKSEIVTLLFDSFRGPILAGVRSAGSGSRQLLYGAANYRIDVRFEPQIDSEKIVLIGQVLNSTDPEDRLDQMPVALLKGRKVVAESVTGQFGEFQIECDMEGALRLKVRLPSTREISLPLVDPTFVEGDRSLHPADVSRVRNESKPKKKGTRTKG
jgi:hypothetical protein